MFTLSTLKSGLKGWIGVRDMDEESLPQLDSDITTATSGRYYDDYHPLLHTNAIYYSSPNFEGNNYDYYDAGTTYSIGDKVTFADIPWTSKVNTNTGNTPAVGANWETSFSKWLEEKTEASVSGLFDRLSTHKKLTGSTKSIFSNLQLFTGAGKLSDTITKSSRLVGLRVKPRNVNNIQAVLNHIGIQFSVAQTSLNIYLWHSSRKAYYKVQAVTTTGTNQFNWVALTDYILNYVDFTNDIESGGEWFIGYFEADITGSAINKTYDFYTGPCVGCPNTMEDNITRYNLWSKYVNVMPFYVINANLDGTNLPAVENMVFDETTNFGMNLSLTVKPDFTELILDNKHLITYPLGVQFAADMMRWIAYNPSTRKNPPQTNASRDTILYELDGAEDTQADGIKIELVRAINGLAEDLSNLSTALPNDKPTRIKRGAI